MEEIEILKELFPKYGWKKVSDVLGRNRGSIEKRAARLGLHVDRSCYSHPSKGKFNLLNRGENNGMWKGDDVGYCALHEWVKRYLKKPKFCQNCGERVAYDLANISQEYKRDLLDWEWLCRICHMKKDGRIYNLNCRKEGV